MVSLGRESWNHSLQMTGTTVSSPGFKAGSLADFKHGTSTPMSFQMSGLGGGRRDSRVQRWADHTSRPMGQAGVSPVPVQRGLWWISLPAFWRGGSWRLHVGLLTFRYVQVLPLRPERDFRWFWLWPEQGVPAGSGIWGGVGVRVITSNLIACYINTGLPWWLRR